MCQILAILSSAGKDIFKRQLYFFSEIIFYFISIGLHGKFQMTIFMLFHGMLMKGFSNVLN